MPPLSQDGGCCGGCCCCGGGDAASSMATSAAAAAVPSLHTEAIAEALRQLPLRLLLGLQQRL